MSVQATSSAVVAPVLLHGLAKNWWLFLIRGIAAIVFGILTVAFAFRLRRHQHHGA